MADKRKKRKEFFAQRLPLYRKDIILFFREVLCFEPDNWQKEAGIAIVKDEKVSIRSGQGIGKTAFEAGVLLWFLVCFPYARVVATAPTKQQLHDVLWSEVAKWQQKSPLLSVILKWTKTYIYMQGYEKRWFAVARSASRAENMQGFHADNMLIIVDEASGVNDEIMEAILGTLSGGNNKLLMCGNPTRASGTFYDSHTKDRGDYTIFRISSEESPRTNKRNIASLKRKYGENSNVVRVRVYGEFPLQEDDVFIPISLVERAIVREFEDETIETIDIGVDVARFGNDETVIAPKVNNRVLPLKIRKGQNLMQTVGDILLTAKKLRTDYKFFNKHIFVKIDDTGLGGGVTDRLSEIKKEQKLWWLVIIPVNFASKSKSEYYSNITTYVWASVRDMLDENALQLPNDDEMIAQFSVRKYTVVSQGKIELESKDEMKRRKIPSPDRADAVALACMPNETKAAGGVPEISGNLIKESYWK